MSKKKEGCLWIRISWQDWYNPPEPVDKTEEKAKATKEKLARRSSTEMVGLKDLFFQRMN